MKTAFKKRREKRDQAILKHYERLISQPGAMKTACEQAVMKHFDIHSRSTIWEAIKRAKKANLNV